MRHVHSFEMYETLCHSQVSADENRNRVNCWELLTRDFDLGSCLTEVKLVFHLVFDFDLKKELFVTRF